MSVAYVNSGVLKSQTASSTSISPALPASLVAGDILMVVFSARAINTATLSGAGWNLILTGIEGSVSVYLVGWRLVDGSEGQPTITYDVASANLQMAIVHQFSGTHRVAPIGATSNNNGVSANLLSLSITTIYNNALVIYLFLDFTTGALAQPAGWTERSDVGATGGEMSMGDQQVHTLGTATGNAGATITSSRWAALQIEIRALVPATMQPVVIF